MDDSGLAKPGVHISTCNFELKEVRFLILLKKFYDLDCIIQILNNST